MSARDAAMEPSDGFYAESPAPAGPGRSARVGCLLGSTEVRRQGGDYREHGTQKSPAPRLHLRIRRIQQPCTQLNSYDANHLYTHRNVFLKVAYYVCDKYKIYSIWGQV